MRAVHSPGTKPIFTSFLNGRCLKMSENVQENKFLQLAWALATGASQTAAAERVGVSTKTIYRQMGKPSFRRLVAQLREEVVSRALGRMADNMTRAADVLVGLLDEKDPAVRLRAARSMVTLGVQLRESVE